MRIGYKLFAEVFSPQELVAQAVRAEEAGFDFVEISDHYLRYHPAIVAQAAGTTALLCDGRFTLGVRGRGAAQRARRGPGLAGGGRPPRDAPRGAGPWTRPGPSSRRTA